MSKVGSTVFKIVRIAFKVLLCLSILISLDMLCRYLNYFAEPSDGISMWLSPITLLWYGDKYCPSRELLTHFLTSAGYAYLFFVVNIVLDIIAIIKDKKSNVNSQRHKTGGS